VKARLLGSLVIGAIAAGIVVAWDDSAHHAALVASAAKSHGSQTVAAILTSGFIAVALAVSIVVFTLATVRARRRSARAAEREWQPGPARRRSRAGTGW
jgi:heme/copper-type cytochrome/quinol oxidase subunit 2